MRIRESHGDNEFVNQSGVIRSISVRSLRSSVFICFSTDIKNDVAFFSDLTLLLGGSKAFQSECGSTLAVPKVSLERCLPEQP